MVNKIEEEADMAAKREKPNPYKGIKLSIKGLLISGILWGLFSISYGQTGQLSQFSTPSKGPAAAVGSYSNGCLFGGQALSLKAQDYKVMRQSRNRYYGHPNLIRYIEQLSEQVGSEGKLLMLGDLSQPRGGRMPSGHVSHQIGLDVDIWLFTPKKEEYHPSMIEDYPMEGRVDRALGVLNEKWQPEYFSLIEKAASFPEVERIFLNPVIKKALCEYAPEAPWQGKIRPWFGHDAHLHVRLRCPEGDLNCEPQAPVPPGSGCTADLDNWIRDQSDYTLKPKTRPQGGGVAPKIPSMPPLCHALLVD